MKKSIHTPEQKHLQDLLRQARIEAGLTQVQLAEKLDTLQATISNYETGERRLDFIELCQVLDAIGLPLHEFIRRYEQATGQDYDFPSEIRRHKREC